MTAQPQQVLATWALEEVEVLKEKKLERVDCPRCGRKALLTKDGVRWAGWKCSSCGQVFTSCRWGNCLHIHLGLEPPPLCEGCGSWYRLQRLRDDYPGQVLPNAYGKLLQESFAPLPGRVESTEE